MTQNENAKAVLAELTRLEKNRQQTGASKQRHFKRYVVRGEARLMSNDPMDTSTESIEVHLRDLSRGGVGFVCDRELPLESDWKIVFYNQGLEVARQPIVVRHCQSVNNGLYLIGTLFCVEAGLLTILGVNPKELHDGSDVGNDAPVEAASFLPPGEVA